MLSDIQNKLIEKIATENGLKNYSVTVQDVSKKGDNYLGNIFSITIEEKNTGEAKSLILKSALTNAEVRAKFPISRCYEREVFLYETVLPTFVKLQEKYSLRHHFKSFAKLYGYSLEDGNEWLLLEDITSRGFRMLNRKTTMNGEHVSAVVKEHAKLHSLSFVMKHCEPENFKKFADNLEDCFQGYDFGESWFESIKKKTKTIYKITEGDEEATEGLKRFEESVESVFKEFEKEKYKLVVIHGDSWCNNMMFRYENKGNPDKPAELCFIDWQLSKVTVPVTDLVYFMFLSASKEVLDDHKIYLQQYYQILEENLKCVDCDVNQVFPYREFERQWKDWCKCGFSLAIALLQTMMKDEEDARTLTEVVESGKNLSDTFINIDTPLNEQTYKRIKDLICMLVKNKYI